MSAKTYIAALGEEMTPPLKTASNASRATRNKPLYKLSEMAIKGVYGPMALPFGLKGLLTGLLAYRFQPMDETVVSIGMIWRGIPIWIQRPSLSFVVEVASYRVPVFTEMA